jgi:CDP-glucose 4,6-dehydratase
MASVIGDIRDVETLHAAIRRAEPEIVIHMAAQPLVRYGYQHPIETYATNVMGTVHLLEGIRMVPTVRAVLNVTTDKCYENKEWLWGYREIDRLGGYDPYSSSKACSELVSAAYRSSYFNPDEYSRHRVAVATARAGNVIGGGDWAADRLLPDLLKAFSKRECAIVRNPLATRPWQHVLEPLSGYLMILEKLVTNGPQYSGAWNFGPRDSDARSVREIADCVASLWGDSATWSAQENNEVHEANLLKLDISKATKVLGWEPLLELPRALKLLVDWTRRWEDGAEMKQVTLNQIYEYQSQRQAIAGL